VGPATIGASRESPQRAHRGPLWTGNSVQQTLQMGTDERCGRGVPQRTHEAGKRAQLTASMGLRRTRATARQREVPEAGRSTVSEPESLRKTHLASGRQGLSARRLADSIPGAGRGFHEISSSGGGSGSRMPVPGPDSGLLGLLRLPLSGLAIWCLSTAILGDMCVWRDRSMTACPESALAASGKTKLVSNSRFYLLPRREFFLGRAWSLRSPLTLTSSITDSERTDVATSILE